MSDWLKEELNTKEELQETLDWIRQECGVPKYVDMPTDDEIIDNILRSQKNIQIKNPVLSYSWYLLFEALYIEPLYRTFLNDDEYRLPLWIYHHGSVSLRSKIREYDEKYGLSTWYEALKYDDKLDILGEFGEFASWLNFYIYKVSQSYDDPYKVYEMIPNDLPFWEDVKEKVLVNPDWEKVLSKNGDELWNHFYEPEDWMYHDVL